MIKSPPILNNPRKNNSNPTFSPPPPSKEKKTPNFSLAASKSYSLKPFVTFLYLGQYHNYELR
jgi:hypothetical protein